MSSVAPRRSARIAEKAAANNLSSIENLYLYDALYHPQQRILDKFTRLLAFTEQPYKTFVLAIQRNEFLVCAEALWDDYDYQDDYDIRYQYHIRYRFSYQDLESKCSNPTGFYNRFFWAISHALPLLKKHIQHDAEQDAEPDAEPDAELGAEPDAELGAEPDAEQLLLTVPESVLLLHNSLLKERQQRLLSGGPTTFAEAVVHIISS